MFRFATVRIPWVQGWDGTQRHSALFEISGVHRVEGIKRAKKLKTNLKIS